MDASHHLHSVMLSLKTLSHCHSSSSKSAIVVCHCPSCPPIVEVRGFRGTRVEALDRDLG